MDVAEVCINTPINVTPQCFRVHIAAQQTLIMFLQRSFTKNAFRFLCTPSSDPSSALPEMFLKNNSFCLSRCKQAAPSRITHYYIDGILKTFSLHSREDSTVNLTSCSAKLMFKIEDNNTSSD